MRNEFPKAKDELYIKGLSTQVWHDIWIFQKKYVSLALALPICLANRNGDILPIFRAGYRGGGTEIAPNPGAQSWRPIPTFVG